MSLAHDLEGLVTNSNLKMHRVEPSLNEVVKQWRDNNYDCGVILRLEGCANDLAHWNKTHCNKLKTKIEPKGV